MPGAEVVPGDNPLGVPGTAMDWVTLTFTLPVAEALLPFASVTVNLIVLLLGAVNKYVQLAVAQTCTPFTCQAYPVICAEPAMLAFVNDTGTLLPALAFSGKVPESFWVSPWPDMVKCAVGPVCVTEPVMFCATLLLARNPKLE
jgi:hypothetical protein